MKYIELTQGYRAIVDDADFELVNSRKWQVVKSPANKPYALHVKWVKNAPNVHEKMHRFIMGLKR